MLANYKKLTSGEWAVKILLTDPFDEFPETGSDILITKKSGETVTRRLSNQIFTAEDEAEDGSKTPIAVYGLE